MSKIYDKLKDLETVTEEDLEHIEIIQDEADGNIDRRKGVFKAVILTGFFFIAIFVGIMIAKYYSTFSKNEAKKVITVTENPVGKPSGIVEKKKKYQPSLFKGDARFIEVLEKKYRDKPENPANANNLAVAYTEAGRYNEALKYAEKALLLSPDNAFFWNNLGVVLTYLNLYTDAEKCFLKAMEISKDEGLFFYNMANLYERMGNELLARENYLSYLSKSDKINPANVEIVRNTKFKGDK